MKPRMPYAMRTMIEEITSVVEDAQFELYDEDAYGVYRGVKLDEPTTREIGPVLDLLHDDRVFLHAVIGSSYHIVFETDPRAEDKSPFHLDEAYRVLKG